MATAKTFRTSLTIFTGFAVALMLASLAVWTRSDGLWAIRRQAEESIAQLNPDGQLNADEYAVWNLVAESDPPYRLEVAKVLQEKKYQPVLYNSGKLISNALIGFDYSGTVSRQLAEQLICKNLQTSSRVLTDDNEASLYLVPALNPQAMDSEYCANVLVSTLATAAPDSLLQRTTLLAMVLGRLPKEQAAPYVTEILRLMDVMRSADMDLLFNAMRHLNNTDFSEALSTAAELLTGKIRASQSSSEIATLFESVNYLKYEISAEQLTPVLDAALGKMLELRNTDLTHALYFTLADLKVSHPETSFGRRADYLMQGINIFGVNVDIADYSGVLRLDEQYGSSQGYETAMAKALLADIRNLGEDEYLGAIRPYCRRFLELSGALGYEDFLSGATLLIEQLRNANFIFQRECLHEPALVERLEPADKEAMAAIVVSALQDYAQPLLQNSASRTADLVEMLGLLGAPPTAEQIRTVVDVIRAILLTEPDPYLLGRVAIAVTGSGISFAPDFYGELFVNFANAAPDPANPLHAGTRTRVLSLLLENLPSGQRVDLVSTSLAAFSAQEDPAELATHAEFLVALQSSIPQEAKKQAALTLLEAAQDTRDAPIFTRLTGLIGIFAGRLSTDQRAALRAATLRHIATSNQRAELAGLFNATRSLQVSTTNVTERAILEAAAVRFLGQLQPADSLEGHVRAMMKKLKIALSPADVAQLSAQFILALGDGSANRPGNFASSVETLALHARPGELSALLQAIRVRLNAVTSTVSHELLLGAWAAVESSSNKDLPQEQRIPLYLDVLQLPLNTSESHALLIGQIEKFTQQNFEGDLWAFAAWAQEAGLVQTLPEVRANITAARPL